MGPPASPPASTGPCISLLPTHPLTTVPDGEASREEADEAVGPPGRHVDEVLRGVLQREAEGATIHTHVWRVEVTEEHKALLGAAARGRR